MHLLSLKSMVENKTNKRKNQWWTRSYAPSQSNTAAAFSWKGWSHSPTGLPSDPAGATEKPQFQPCATCQQLTKTTHTSEGNQTSLSSRLMPRGRETLRRQLQMLGRRWKFTFSNYLELLWDWNCAIRTHCLYLGVSHSNKLSLNLLMQSTNQYKKKVRNRQFS